MTDLAAVHSRMEAQLGEAVSRVMRGGRFIRSSEVNALEEELAEYVGVSHARTCANGTEALMIALMALDLRPGDEVITTSFSFIAAAEAAKFLGLRVVFADIDPVSFNIDPRKIEGLITPRTRALLPVHLFGRMAAMDAIADIAERHGLHIVEDAAQAFGAEQVVGGRRRKACSVGTIGCTSFFPTKNLGGMGDGGALFTNSDILVRKIATIASHGAEVKYHSTRLGLNSRLDEIQAAVLRVKLRRLDEYVSRRRAAALAYRKALAGNDFFVCPADADGHTFNQFTLRVNYGCRDDVRQFMARRGVETMIYYPEPIHRQPVFGHDDLDLPETDKAAAQVLSIPMHSELSTAEIAYVADTLNAWKIGAHRQEEAAAL